MMELSIQDGILGCYTPSFLQMYLSFSYDGDLNHLSDKDFGTFVHEYIHFLQNTSTPWGLYTSCVAYSSLADVFSRVKQMSQIHRPIDKFSTSDSDARKNLLCRKGQGDTSFPWISLYKRGGPKPLEICRPINIREKDNQCVLSITLGNGQRKEVILGAYIIKESMAAMYQSLADRAAEHDDIPYNVVRLIAEDYYKNICYDIRKLISICYLSLYSMQPATVLLDQMRFANANPQMSGLDIVIKFIQENHIVKYDSDGRKAVMSVTDFFNFVVTRFEKILGKLIGNTTFISESIQRVNISTGFVPIIQILYENDPFDRNSFNTLVKGCGIPHIYTEFSEEHWPSCVCDSKKTNIASNDVLQLFVLNAMYEYLTNNRFACPLLSYCNKKDDADCKNILWKDECYGTPWEGRECIMTMVANFIGIQDKKII